MKAVVVALPVVIALLSGQPDASAAPKLQHPVKVVYPAMDAKVPPNVVLFLQWQRPYRVTEQFNAGSWSIRARCEIEGTARIALMLLEFQSGKAVPIQVGFGGVPSLMTIKPAAPLSPDAVYILRMNAKSLGDMRSGLDLREGSLVRFATSKKEARPRVPVLRRVRLGLSGQAPERSATLQVTAAGPPPPVIGWSVWIREAIDVPWKKAPWRLAPLTGKTLELPASFPEKGYFRVTVLPWSITGHEGLPGVHQGPIK